MKHKTPETTTYKGDRYKFKGYVNTKKQIPKSHEYVGYVGRKITNNRINAIAVYSRKK